MSERIEATVDGVEIEACTCCDAEDPAGYFQANASPAFEDGPGYLCEVCFSTFCSAGYLYPSSIEHATKQVLTSIAQCTNMVLRRLEAIEERLKT